MPIQINQTVKIMFEVKVDGIIVDGSRSNKPFEFSFGTGQVIAGLEKRIINISNVYKTTKYKFEGTKEFDKKTKYFSKSMLVIPLINHENEVIGVLQLINKIKNKEIISFDRFDEKVIISLASQAAMALTNMQLIKSLEDLFTNINALLEDQDKLLLPKIELSIFENEKWVINQKLHCDCNPKGEAYFGANDFDIIILFLIFSLIWTIFRLGL